MAKILVINCGSSTIKYQLFNMDTKEVLCSGLVEKIGESISRITHKKFPDTENATKTVILFWSYSCPHCRDLIYEMGELAEKDKSIAIVTVNVSGDLKDVRRILKKSGLGNAYNVRDGLEWNSPIVDAFAVDMTPTMILLDADKTIIAKPYDFEELINCIDK